MSDSGPCPPSLPPLGGLASAGHPHPPSSPGADPSQPAGGGEPVPRDKPSFYLQRSPARCRGAPVEPGCEGLPRTPGLRVCCLALCVDAWHPGVGLGGSLVGASEPGLAE